MSTNEVDTNESEFDEGMIAGSHQMEMVPVQSVSVCDIILFCNQQREWLDVIFLNWLQPQSEFGTMFMSAGKEEEGIFQTETDPNHWILAVDSVFDV